MMLNIFLCFVFAYINIGIIQLDVEFCVNVSLILFFYISYTMFGNHILYLVYNKINKIYVILYGVIKYNYIFILLLKDMVYYIRFNNKKVKLIDKFYILKVIYSYLNNKMDVYYNTFLELLGNKIVFQNGNLFGMVKISYYEVIVYYLEGSFYYDSKVE